MSRDFPPVVTRVAASATDVPVLAENKNRRGLEFHNDSGSNCFLLATRTATAASATVYTWFMPPGAIREIRDEESVTCAIRGIWTSATGSINCVEYV